MSVAKVIEISSTSTESFEDAIRSGIVRANETLKGITGAWIQDQEVKVRHGSIIEYQVRLRVTFVLE
jgi:flavin-binding protein dodecin